MEAEQQQKKLKIFDSDSGAYLGSQDDTRERIRANEVITLNFSFGNSNIFSVHPTFCHQLFDEEEILLPKNAQIEIFVSIDVGHNLRNEVLICDRGCELADRLTDIEVIEISEKLQKGVPECSRILAGIQELKPAGPSGTCFYPVGFVIDSFNLGDEIYELRLCTAKDQGASMILSRAEKLAMYFIETADSVNFSDDRWEALFLFRVLKPENDQPKIEENSGQDQTNEDYIKNYVLDETKYLLVGYFTLFTFRNPFVGNKLRVCQVLTNVI